MSNNFKDISIRDHEYFMSIAIEEAMADIKNIVVGTEDTHMATKDLIKNHKWLNKSISNYITCVNEEACRDLILNYCDEKTIARLLGSK